VAIVAIFCLFGVGKQAGLPGDNRVAAAAEARIMDNGLLGAVTTLAIVKAGMIKLRRLPGGRAIAVAAAALSGVMGGRLRAYMATAAIGRPEVVKWRGRPVRGILMTPFAFNPGVMVGGDGRRVAASAGCFSFMVIGDNLPVVYAGMAFFA
jgi:hypothetical protein